MSDQSSSMISQMKNNSCLQNVCSRKRITKKNENMNGDNNKISNLPEPKIVFYPPLQVKLGWQDTKMLVGSGLDNSGVVCYINATLQALFHIPAFINWLVNDEKHKKMCQQKTGDQKNCIVCMVYDTFLKAQKHTVSSFEASAIISNLSLICQRLSTSKQEDAHEYLRHLIEGMEQSYMSVLGHKTECLNSYFKETTPISQIFGARMRNEVTCGDCGHISTTFQPCQEFILDISQSATIKDALDKYFEKENLADKSYTCEGCQRKVLARKKFSIEKAPNVLCIQLKRYNISMSGRENKISKAIQISERLNLSDYQFEYHKHKTDAQPLVYRLVSMVLHQGTTLNSGHYTALGLTPSGSYYYFNDSKVYQTKLQYYLKNKESYLIFYELEPGTKPNINNNKRQRCDKRNVKRSKKSNGNSHEILNGNDNDTITTDFQNDGHNKSDGNSFEKSMKSSTHLGFCSDGETGNDGKSFVDRKSEQSRHGRMKRSFDDDYTEEFNKRVVKKTKFDNHHNNMKDDGFHIL